MLRSVVPEENELMTLCKSKAWKSAIARAESHPSEAEISDIVSSGFGSTVLATAVRCGAPKRVLQALVKANVHQVGIANSRRGTVLHEALSHRCNVDVLQYLLQSLIQYERTHNRKKLNVFKVRDDLGRTVLHHLVHHNLREALLEDNGRTSANFSMFRTLVLACPDAIGKMDADGYTPLMLLLSVIHRDEGVEAQLFRMVQLLVAAYPPCASISRKSNTQQRHVCHPDCCCNDEKTCTLVGDGAPNPLSTALLYGRKQDIINVLLHANDKVGANACMSIISQHHEVPLHVAVTMRAPPSTLSRLIEHGSGAVHVSDKHGLAPLDWLWIRFVVDVCSTQPPLSPVMVSKRRYVSNQFLEWHRRVTEQLKDRESLDKIGTVLRDQLWQRASQLIKAAVQDDMPTLHTACSVTCPLALVRLALEECLQKQFITRDSRGRLPLHYAAERLSYKAQVPLGVQKRLCSVQEEESPADLLLERFPEATRVVDNQHQLPLHIAIDCSKQRDVNNDSVVCSLLSKYPDALERRDGKTKLFPFLQAAAGNGAHTSTIYTLLRDHPTLVNSGLQ